MLLAQVHLPSNASEVAFTTIAVIPLLWLVWRLWRFHLGSALYSQYPISLPYSLPCKPVFSFSFFLREGHIDAGSLTWMEQIWAI